MRLIEGECALDGYHQACFTVSKILNSNIFSLKGFK